MSLFSRSKVLLFNLYLVSAIMLPGGVPSGTGVFNFTSPRNGKTITVFYVKAASYNAEHPPVMVFHGMDRNPDHYRDGWIHLARQYGLFVVCPFFSQADFHGTVGYNLGNVFPSETDLTRNPESAWSYHVPEDVFNHLVDSGDTTAAGYFAFGHSAGSQFLHRKLAFAPSQKLLLAVAANAGWYTLPSLEETWPYGFKGTGLTQDNLTPYLASNLLILLGDQDVDTQDDSLRKTPEAMRQGPHRFARGHFFHKQGQALARELETTFNWQLHTVPGVAHDGAGMAPAAARLMVKRIEELDKDDNSILLVLASLIIAGTVFLIIRQYQTHATLFISGFVLLLVAYIYSKLTGDQFTAFEESPTGWFGFDLFAIVKNTFSTRLAEIGLIIMAAGGFARYMSAICASDMLVGIAVKPLSRLKSPYLLLALAYGVGQVLNIFVPSAAGLAMLLLVAMYPTLVKLGLRPVSVAAVIGTTACLDLGPASGASNLAAGVSNLTPVVYFVKYQLPVAIIVIPVVGMLHFFWQRFCDRTFTAEDTGMPAAEVIGEKKEDIPAYYAILPVLPLLLLLVFSPLVVQDIQVDVVTAMLVGLFVGISCETLRLRSLKDALAGIVHFFKGMGDIFAKVVTLIVAAETFASGVKSTGIIDSMIDAVQGAGIGSGGMMIALVLLIGFTAVVTGSGNAALFSFANMIPGIARPLGASTVSFMLPSQLAAGLFRSVSPVAGVIIAVAGTANVSPFAIVRRTFVPMLGGVVAMLLASSFL